MGFKKFIFLLFFILSFGNVLAINKAEIHMPQKDMQSSIESKNKVRFIVNPNSGTKNKNFIIKIIHKYLDKSKYDYEFCYTKAPKHATELSKEAANLNYAVVVAIGGDGTVNEVGRGLIGTNTKMAIIPTGSGNGLAKHLYIPNNPIKAIRVINNFRYTNIDSIKINEEMFFCVAGIGFDAHIAEKFSKANKRGFLSYASLILQEYSNYKSKPFEMIIDGQKKIIDGFLISFANGSQYGNDIQIAPDARIGDGYFRIAVLKDPPFLKKLSTLIKLRNGSIEKSKYFESFKCKSLVINQKNLVAHIDGEPIFFENGIEISPYKKIGVLVP